MHRLHRVGFAFLATGIIALTVIIYCSPAQVEARQQYFNAFKEKYSDVKGAETAKCAICHVGPNKKMRNDYGQALQKKLKEVTGDDEVKDLKDTDKINEALTKVEEENSATKGKTYGDLLKAGKMPSGKGGGTVSGGRRRKG